NIQLAHLHVGHVTRDDAFSARLGIVATAAEKAVRDARSASGPPRDLDGAVRRDLDLQDVGGPSDDGRQVVGVVEVEVLVYSEAVAERGGDQAGARGRSDEREGRQLQF